MHHGTHNSLLLGPAIIGGLVILYGGGGFLIVKLVRWLKRKSETSLARIYEELVIEPDGDKQGVLVVFHTYHGFLAYVRQREHRVVVPADRAEALLRRLHWHNVKWGSFAAGALLIPIVSFANFKAQQAAVRRQIREQQAAESPAG